MYPAKIGRARGWSKQHVDYYVKKLEKAGLIRRLKRSNFVDYELTERGQNFLISCEGILFSSGVFRLHRCFFKFPVLREGVYPSPLLERRDSAARNGGSLASRNRSGGTSPARAP